MRDQEDPSLDDLLVAVGRQDRAAFSALYARTAPKLHAVALRILRQRTLAEDALQEAFVDIWRRAGSFDPERGSAGAWLSVVARNRAIDVARRRMRDVPEAPDGDIERLAAVVAPGSGTGGDRSGESVDLMALLHCLRALDEETGEAILLAYYEGRSRDELAVRFGRPEGTIKTWLRRGLMRLRACLDE